MLDAFPNRASCATEPKRAKHCSRSLAKAIVMLGLFGTMTTGDAALARRATSWPDTREARAHVQNLIESLHARLLASQTATAALEAWCADHKLANVAAIRARIVRGIDKPLTTEQRERLQIDGTEPIKYRRVELVCGHAYHHDLLRLTMR